MKRGIVFFLVHLVFINLGAAVSASFATDVSLDVTYNPPRLNMKVGVSWTVVPCDTSKYYYNYYYVQDGTTVLLEERATECKDHRMGISLPKNSYRIPVTLRAVVSSELSEIGVAEWDDWYEFEDIQEWFDSVLSHDLPYDFVPGWNPVCWSCRPHDEYNDPTDSLPAEYVFIESASEWLASINEQGGAATKIRAFDGGEWQTYTVGDTSGDFAIDLQKGYFIYSESPSSWQKSIPNQYSCGDSLPLEDGWNFVGGYLYGQTTASGLIQRLQEDGISISKIQTWDGGGWHTYTDGAGFGDFELDRKKGYLIYKEAE